VLGVVIGRGNPRDSAALVLSRGSSSAVELLYM
jgi:hypothetical protein